MNREEKRAAAECEALADNADTRLNTDITENLKSVPEGSLSPREKSRLRAALEREQAASRERRSTVFEFLRGLWRRSR